MMDKLDTIQYTGFGRLARGRRQQEGKPRVATPAQPTPCGLRRAAVFGLLFCFVCALLLAGAAQSHAARGTRAVILVNMDTGKVLFEKNADISIPPASLTKVMSMFLTLDAVSAKRLKLDEKIRITPAVSSVGGSSMHLRKGERVSVRQLLTGSAVASGNDAITALALRVSGNQRQFVRAMNQKATSLGLKRTEFKNPTGLPAAGQRTSPRDMATLTRAYLRAHPGAQQFHSTRVFTHRNRQMSNTNALLGTVRGVNGLKTGWTVASGYNLIVTAQRGKTRLLAVVMGGTSRNARDSMAKRLIEAGFDGNGNTKKIRRAMGYRR